MRKALEYGNIGCGVFVVLQRAFDTVDHQILLAKSLNYCYKSCLSNSNQYVSRYGFESGLAAINCGVPKDMF